jgi:O-acetyl-ADP-ribose deacetylase (regulator of RNase III)
MSQIISSYLQPSGQVIEIYQGDLTKEPVDAIVNAANEHLMHGAGVAGAIRSAGGPVIIQESAAWVRTHGPVSHTEPAYTSAGNLPCRFVIHAVGPIWGEGDEDRKLQEAITGSVKRAEELQAHSLAFPAISTGIFGFPVARAARIFIKTLRQYFNEHPQSGVQVVRLVLWDRETTQIFAQEAADDQLSA